MQPRAVHPVLLGDGENRLDVEDANRVGGRDRVLVTIVSTKW